MGPMTAPDFLTIPFQITKEMCRRMMRRSRSSILYRWRLSGPIPEKLFLAPADLRPADITIADQIYAGNYTFSRQTVLTKGSSPFAMAAPSSEWFDELHGFRWLSHLRAADTDLSRANANALVNDWIESWGQETNSAAWKSHITATRLISWLCHGSILLSGMTEMHQIQFRRSIARQSRYLAYNANYVRDGHPRLHSYIALVYVAICVTDKEKVIKSATRDLDRELERQILADGVHISRNPCILVEILADLLPLKQAYIFLGHEPSPLLVSSIDRLMAALRFFRHNNGELAQFNGTGTTPFALLETVLKHDDSKGLPQKSAPHSGYERLAAKTTVILMDTGKALSRCTAQKAMAGALSFELSSGTTRFIANCGIPDTQQHLYAPFARSTAAQSTVTIADTASCRFASEKSIFKMLPSPLIRSPKTITCKRFEENNFQNVIASHDGYGTNFNIIHSREIQLSNDGNQINGVDRFSAADNNNLPSHPIAVRFHLPQPINASRLSSGHSILIAAPDNDAWTFTCVDAPIALEESIQFSGPEDPRKAEQIVVHADSATHSEIRWVLERRQKAPTRSRKRRGEAEGAMPDLLDTLNQSAQTDTSKNQN